MGSLSSPPSPVPGPRSPVFTVFGLWRDGWKRVLAAPAIAAGVFAMTILLALPLAITCAERSPHISATASLPTPRRQVSTTTGGRSSRRRRPGLERRFRRASSALRRCWRTSAACLMHARASLRSRRHWRCILPAGRSCPAASWTDMRGSGRFASYGFFAASGAYFFRFLRLAAIAGLVYWWLFAYVHRWFFDDLFVDLTRSMSVERNTFLVAPALLHYLRRPPACNESRRRLHEGAHRR